MQIIIHDEVIEMVIERKKIKNIYIRFKEDGKLYVSCNAWTSLKEIENLIQANQKKLEAMYQSLKKVCEKNQFFQYLGNNYTILYDENVKECSFDHDLIVCKNEKQLGKFYQSEVERIFTSEVERILPYFEGIPKFTLKFQKMKTRWGVNNRGNNTITLNTELLKKKIDLLDYVIIHELCHFYEANHSSRFWAHVSKYYPDYKGARKRLREE